jgi:succinyl-diaminopimelate desuccinylase
MDYLKVLKDIIAIDTTVPPGRNYRQLMEYLEPLFREVGFQTQIVSIPRKYTGDRPGRFNLFCHRRYEDKPRMIFYAHADVVPAGGWDAFVPRVEGDKIYGRGAADMKGGIVGLLLGLEAVKGSPLTYDTTIAITTDEEYDQASQIRYIKKYLEPVAGAAVFSLDSSSGFVSITGLGSLGMVIKVKGRSVHSALSHRGVNAVEKAVPLMQALLELKSRVVTRRSVVRAYPATGLTQMEARLNLNMVQGGLKGNIIPDECIITVDRRLIPEENLETAEQEMLAALKSVPGVEWEIEQVFRIPTVPPAIGPVVDRLAGIIREVTGDTGQYGEMGSGDLANIVVNEWGGQEFGLGVIRTESNIHGRDEFVYGRDIEDLGKIVARFLVA